MSLSRELLNIAGDLAALSLAPCAPIHDRLCRLAIRQAMQDAEVITLREWADETVGNACEDEQTLAEQSRAIADGWLFGRGDACEDAQGKAIEARLSGKRAGERAAVECEDEQLAQQSRSIAAVIAPIVERNRP